jgi:hypothetical protein
VGYFPRWLKKPRKLQAVEGFLAVEAVISELVSAGFSLFHGKIQGNSSISGLR